MTVISILELRIKPEALGEAAALIHDTLEVTRARPGSLGVEVTVDVDDPAHYVVLEKWATLADDDAYRAFRATAEGASQLGTIVAEAPKLTRAELHDDL